MADVDSAPPIIARTSSFLERCVLAVFHRPLKSVARVLPGLTFVYVGSLIVVLGLMEWYGEKEWLISTLLFLPPTLWALPAIVLWPLCLLLRRRLCWLHGAAIFLVLFGFMHFRISAPRPRGPDTLTVLSANVAQRKLGGFWNYVREEDPDIVVMAEAASAKGLPSEYRQRFIASRDQFTIVSKFPVKSAGLVPGMVPPLYYDHQCAAVWFEIDYHGQSIMVYAVHMPTPRPFLYSLRGSGFISSAEHADGVFSAQTRGGYMAYWNIRFDLAQTLLTELDKEKRPCLLAGDFNMPDHGYLYHEIAGRLTDAFAAKGTGYGLTFPGATLNPLSLFGPWLRIDYQFADAHWQVDFCHVEPRKLAKHLAVVGGFELKPGSQRADK